MSTWNEQPDNIPSEKLIAWALTTIADALDRLAAAVRAAFTAPARKQEKRETSDPPRAPGSSQSN